MRPTLSEVQEMNQPGAWDHPDSGPANGGHPKEFSTELKRVFFPGDNVPKVLAVSREHKGTRPCVAGGEYLRRRGGSAPRSRFADRSPPKRTFSLRQEHLQRCRPFAHLEAAAAALFLDEDVGFVSARMKAAPWVLLPRGRPAPSSQPGPRALGIAGAER